MEQYISKNALVAEIERRIKCIIKEYQESQPPSFFLIGKINGLENIRLFLETLEVKEVQEEPVSEELEEASKEWLRPQLDKSYANYGEDKMMELTHFDGYAMLDAIEFGAKWKAEQFEKKD